VPGTEGLFEGGIQYMHSQGKKRLNGEQVPAHLLLLAGSSRKGPPRTLTRVRAVNATTCKIPVRNNAMQMALQVNTFVLTRCHFSYLFMNSVVDKSLIWSDPVHPCESACLFLSL
jgi:hypothetical protein